MVTLSPCSALVALSFLALSACAEPCKDDGLGQKGCPAEGSAEGDADAEGTGSASAESGSGDVSASAESGSGSADATDSMDGTETMGESSESGSSGSDEGMGECDNGMMDGDETDIDCGGSCGRTCKDGDACLDAADCINDACVEDYCGDPVCDPDESNSCQGCLQQECCDDMIACFADPACACWFECISHNNDFAPCKDMCMVGNVGAITSCANSRCNYEGACGA